MTHRPALLAAVLLVAVLAPVFAQWSSSAVATTTPTGPLTVTMPAPVTARATLDPSSPEVVPVPITVTQFYELWPGGWSATPSPELTATVTLTGTDPGELVLDQTGLTLTVTGSNATTITLSGASAAVATALASRISWEVPETAGSVTLDVTVEHNLPANTYQDPASNRLYRVMSVSGDLGGDIEWGTARAAATARSLWGLTGYLGTLTSASEQTFVRSLLPTPTGSAVHRYWIGASDSASEGTWRWMDGPEAGNIFYGSGAPPGTFTAWGPNQPDNFAGIEDNIHFTLDSSSAWWNDAAADPWVIPTTDAIIEFGAVPQTDDPRRDTGSTTLTVRSRFDHLVDYADANGTTQAFPTAPDAAEWIQAGVTGVSTSEFTSSLLSVLARSEVTGTAVDSTAELQAIVDAYSTVISHASTSGSSTAPTSAQWTTLGVTSLDDAAIARLNTAVALAGATGVDTIDELLALADVAATTTTTSTTTTTTTTTTSSISTTSTTTVPVVTETVTTTTTTSVPDTTSSTSTTTSVATTTVRPTTTTTTVPVEFVVAPTASGRPAGQPVIALEDGSTVVQAPLTGSLIVDGEATTITVRRATDATIVAEGGGLRVSLGAVAPDGTPVPLTGDGLAAPHGATVTVTADGFASGGAVDVWAFSSPVFLGSGTAGGGGSLVLDVEVPELLEPGAHTVQFTGESAAGDPIAVSIGVTVVAPEPVAEPVAEPPATDEAVDTVSSGEAQAAGDGTTDAGGDAAESAAPADDKAPPFAPVSALDDPAALVTTATAGVAALAAASAAGASAAAAARGAGGGARGGGSGSGGSRSGGRGGGSGGGSGGESRGGEQTEERAELRSVDVVGIATEFDGSAAGDAGRLWRWPGTGLVDRWTAAWTVGLATRAPMVSRLIADGSALRAMFGSLSTLLPAAGVGLGVAAVIDTAGIAMPPATGLMLAIIVLGVIDAFAGALAFAVYAVGVVLSGGILDLDSVRALMGIAVLCFAPGLIAAAFRPIRRTPAANTDEVWERVVDLAVLPLLAGMTAQAMVWALNGVAGVDFPFGYEADRVAVFVIVTTFVKVLIEEAAGRLFPERMLVVCPPDVPEPSAVRSAATVLMKTAVYVFIVVTILGNVWHLWAAAAMFGVPLLLGLIADRLPNVPVLWRVVPLGVPSMVMYFLVGIYGGGWIEAWLGETPDYARMSFVAFSAAFALIALLYVFGREGKEGEDRWCYQPRWRWVYRIGGAAMLWYAVALHMGWA